MGEWSGTTSVSLPPIPMRLNFKWLLLVLWRTKPNFPRISATCLPERTLSAPFIQSRGQLKVSKNGRGGTEAEGRGVFVLKIQGYGFAYVGLQLLKRASLGDDRYVDAISGVDALLFGHHELDDGFHGLTIPYGSRESAIG